MEWSFKPTRPTPISDIADAIHSMVTMDDVVRHFAPEFIPKQHRIPCPIHHGKDYNFSYTAHGYKCFVCGASGDVITFVKEVRELSTRVDAMKLINDELRLGLPIDSNCDENFTVQISEHRREAERKKAEQEAWDKRYDNLMAEYAILDSIAMFCGQITAVSKAKERMAYISYLLDCMPKRPE